MVTTKQIAELAGVSRGTVDRVLNGRGQVKKDTKDRVQEIANKLNYKPNPSGRSLAKTQKGWKVGCIIIKSDNPFYEELCTGIKSKLVEYEVYGLETILVRVEFDSEAQCEAIDSLLEQNINALILQPIDDTLLREKLVILEERNIPIVTINTTLPNYTPFCYVGNDFYTCGKTAANLLQLVTGGSCKIGIITGFYKAQSHYHRVLGFKDYIQDFRGMEIIEIEENLDDDYQSFYRTKEMLKEHPEINALFLVAGGVYGACRALKTFPHHKSIRVISFDTVSTTKNLVSDGTIFATIDQQPIKQGMLALEVLFNKLIYNTNPPGDTIFTDIVIKLETTI